VPLLAAGGVLLVALLVGAGLLLRPVPPQPAPETAAPQPAVPAPAPAAPPPAEPSPPPTADSAPVPPPAATSPARPVPAPPPAEPRAARPTPAASTATEPKPTEPKPASSRTPRRDRLNAHLLVKQGDQLRAAGNLDGAIRAYLQAEEVDATLPALQKKLAVCYQQQGDTARARERYQRYLATDPPDAAKVKLILEALQ
jgi:outer membrane biosynthesis protein TonB